MTDAEPTTDPNGGQMPNAVEYAENTLGVHTVYDEAQQRLAAYETAVKAEATSTALIRQIKVDIADKESDLVAFARTTSECAGMSATAFNAYMKEALAANEDMRELRRKLAAAEGDRDAQEADRRYHEQGVRVHCARMDELSGLLHFFAVAKQQQGETA